MVWYYYCLCFEPGETEAQMSLKVKVIIDGEDVLRDKNASFITKSFWSDRAVAEFSVDSSSLGLFVSIDASSPQVPMSYPISF